MKRVWKKVRGNLEIFHVIECNFFSCSSFVFTLFCERISVVRRERGVASSRLLLDSQHHTSHITHHTTSCGRFVDNIMFK